MRHGGKKLCRPLAAPINTAGSGDALVKTQRNAVGPWLEPNVVFNSKP